MRSSPSRQRGNRRKAARVIAGSGAALVIVLVVFPDVLGSERHPDQGPNTTTTTMSLSDVQSTYEAVRSEYATALVSPNAAIATATVDITKQEGRIRSDVSTYNYNESGGGCSGSATYFDSCVSNEQVTAQSALGDENAATLAEKADVTTQIKSVQQIETAITAFVQQLDGIPWPSSVSLEPLSLTRALSDSRGTYAQVAIDLAHDKAISTDSQAIAAAEARVATQLGAMASALGVPTPSSPTTS
jgi:hypothetical protein